ncbi:hypothetical protein PTKU64_49850 [Paraburkholderia terrae]|uniref:FAD synthase n=1 Tax=Paraburkholderia terrae TaxID=311230 RepID=A0ABM7TSG0_9BURK|nr:FMN adenylyltransferase [Paraburkholderia terrae]BCZ81310.1 hypothetical protein PTKU64_49850 [Paraburkholderia terrae]
MNAAEMGCVISIGMFDGVHRGHRRVLARLRETAARHALPAVVVTFDPHPRRVLQPDKAPPMLASLRRRLALLASTGCVDRTLVLPFDQRLREQGADEFVRHVLVERLGMRALVVGENFACGKGRTGTIRYLAELGQRLEFDLHPVSLRPAFDGSESMPASSTVARQLILNGDVSGAAQVLGRRHEIEGVSGGNGELMLPGGMCIPREGDYAVELVARNADVIPARASIRYTATGPCCFVQQARLEPGVSLTMRFIDALVSRAQTEGSRETALVTA